MLEKPSLGMLMSLKAPIRLALSRHPFFHMVSHSTRSGRLVHH